MTTENEHYKYDAFISYRHTPNDMEIAEKLHTLLETSKPPKGFKRIKRVFRDRDELPTSSNLADSILDALKNSGYLIVICSPRTPLSQWVIQEIVTFRKLHGNDRILALLIEGEPQESFPKELLVVDGVQVEPLAADIRADDLKSMKKKLKVELLRILAPIYGCNYDDLKQRHRTRKMKRIATIFACITAFSLAFGSFSLRQALLLQDKTEKLEKSETQLLKTNDDLLITNDSLESANDLLAKQYDTLQLQVDEILTGQSKYIAKTAIELADSGDRRTAILLATQGLPSTFNPLDRPYVAEAEYALFRAINPYKLGTDFTGDYYAHHSDGVESMTLSPDGKYVVTQTIDKHIYVWDIQTQEILYKDSYTDYSSTDNAVFVPDTTQLIYISESGLQCVDFITGETIWNSGLEVSNFMALSQQDLLIGQGYLECYIVDMATGQLIKTLPLDLNLKDASFNTSASRFICKDSDYTVMVFDIDMTSDDLLTQVMAIETLYDGFIYYGISPDGQTIYVSSNDYSDTVGYKVGKGELKLYDVTSGTVITYMANDSASFMMPMFNSADPNLLHWYSETVIHSYNIEQSSNLPSMAHGGIITQMKTSVDGTLLMASSYDDTIRFYEVETGNEYEFARFGVPGGVDDFNINGSVLVTMNRLQEDLLIWKNVEGPSLERFDLEASIEQGFYIGNDQCVTISYDGQVSLWDTQTLEHIKVLKQYDTSVLGHYFAKDHSLLLVDNQGNASLYDTDNYELNLEVQLENYSSYTSAIKNESSSIAYIDDDFNFVLIYDSGLNLVSRIPLDRYISGLTYSEDGGSIVLHSGEATMIYPIDASSPQSISDTSVAIELPSSDYISFSSVSDLVAIASSDLLRLYDISKPEATPADVSFNSAISALKFNPTKDEILIALDDESLYLYTYATKETTLIDNNLFSKIASIEFLNGMCLTSYDYSSNVQFRDMTHYVTSSEVSGYVDSSPDGSSLLIKDHKSLLQGPKLSPKDLIELGKTIVGNRVLTEAEKQTYSITTP